MDGPTAARSTHLDIPAVAGVLVVTALAIVSISLVWPSVRLLALLVCYKILSQITTFLVFEPALLYTAKFHSPEAVTLASIAGCIVGGVLDYWVIGPLLYLERVRKCYAGRRWHDRVVRYFRVAPSLTIAAGALSPLPFVAFKALAISSGYPMRRYLVAMTLARIPRYYVLAMFGSVVMFSDWAIGLLTLALLAAWVIPRMCTEESA